MTSISDHFPQFLICPNDITELSKKHNLFKRDTKNFDIESFIVELINTDWPSICSIEKNDPNYSFDMFDSTISKLIDKYLPLKRVIQKKI